MAQITSSVPSYVAVPNFRGDVIVSVAIVVFLGLFVWLSLRRSGPPAAIGPDAAPSVFSSGRALVQLRSITQKPHPVGSLEHDLVRDYILREISAQGLTPAVQKTTAVNRRWGSVLRTGTVENLLARLEGTETGKAVLLVAHYDSWPQAFGASDDGTGVVTLLETLRALKAGAPLKNDVIFLFTDGEESGLLGANAFVEEHPWFADVGLVLNFEARGSRGPSIMFETSEQNGWLIREFAKAAPQPVSHSLAYELYKLLPNDTDLTVFRQRGLAGLNFAYIDGQPSYHTQLDSISELDERSLQHHGSYALALTRHFGNLDLRAVRAPDNVYFDLLSTKLIYYPVSWARWLSAIVVILLLGLVVFGFRRGRLNFKGLALAVLALAVNAIAAAGLTTLIWRIVFKLDYSSNASLQGGTYHRNIYLLSFIALTMGLTAAVYGLFSRRVNVENLTAGALLWWMVLMILTCVYLPGATYLFTWPLLFMLAPFWLILKRGRFQHSLEFLIILFVGALPSVVLTTPLLYQIFTGFGLNGIWVVAVLLVLLLGLLVPHLSLVTRPNKWVLPGASVLVAVVLLLIGIVRPDFDAAHPKPNSLFYGLDANAGRAIWGSFDDQPDEWTARFLSPHPENRPLPVFFSSTTTPYLQMTAPAAPLEPPNVELLDDKSNNDVRTLNLRLTSPRRANVMTLFLDSKVKVLRATVNGKLIDSDNTPALKSFTNNWVLRYYGPPAEGVNVNVEVKTSEPLKVRLLDLSYGLPQLPGAPATDRPDYMIPAAMSSNHTTLVSRSFTF
jgi:Peptidase family M28